MAHGMGPFGNSGMAGREAAMARAREAAARAAADAQAGREAAMARAREAATRKARIAREEAEREAGAQQPVSIEVAVDYGLTQERLNLRPPVRQVIVTEKWERIVDNAERYMKRQGMMRP